MIRQLLLVALALVCVPITALAQATTPPFATNNSGAVRRFISGQEGVAAWYGDSTLHQLEWAPYTAYTTMGIRGYGQGDRFFSAGTQSGVFTGDFTVNQWTEPLDGGSWSGQIDLLGGVSDASDTSTTNRALYVGFIGPRKAATQTIIQEQIFGVNWAGNLISAGQAIEISFPIRLHPNGPTGANWKIAIKEGGTVLNSTAYFDGHDAADQWQLVTTTLPGGGTSTFNFLQAEIRCRPSTATENGKSLIVSAHGRVRNPAATTGQEFHFYGEPGYSVEDFANPAGYPDEQFELLPLYGTNVVFIMLGLNDESGGNPTTFANSLLAMVARIRAAAPSVHVVYVVPHARIFYGARAGGEGASPFYSAGAYAAWEQTTNASFVNLCRLLPDAGTLTGTLASTHSSVTNGKIFQRGDIVTDGSNLYVAKVAHAKIATVPGSDATNWQLINATGSASLHEPRATWRQFLEDGTHHTDPGKFTAMMTLKTALYSLAYSAPTPETIAEAVREELTPELTSLVPNVAPGAPGGLLVAGSNAATTFSTLEANGSVVPSLLQIVDGVWDEPLADHDAEGDMGRVLADTKAQTAAIEIDTGTNIPAALEEIEGSGTVIPVNQVAVPESRTFILEQVGERLVAKTPRGLKAGTNQIFAIDFRNDASANAILSDIDSVESVSGTAGGVTWDLENVEDAGVDKRQAKVRFNGVTAGTYVLDVTGRYGPQDGGGNPTGRITLKVTE